MREIVHLQAGQCGNQIGAKVSRRGTVYLQLLFLSSPVLGSHLRRAWDRSYGYLPRRFRPAAGENQRVL